MSGDGSMSGDEARPDDLVARLAALGSAPVDPALADQHLARLAAVDAAAPLEGHHRRAEPRRGRFSRRAVALAAVVGFLAGSTGLAAAGALPDAAQEVAHDVLGAVGIGVPRSTEGCPEGRQYENHGQYVSEVEAAGGDVEAAAKSDCGKPVKGKGRGQGTGEGTSQGTAGGREGAPGARPDTDGNPCTGPPPWAGAGLTKDEKAARQAERAAQCGTDDADAETHAEAETDVEAGEGGGD